MVKTDFYQETGNISCKNWHGKYRNYKDLREAEEIKKKWQKYTQELYQKVLMTGIIMMVWSLA